MWQWRDLWPLDTQLERLHPALVARRDRQPQIEYPWEDPEGIVRPTPARAVEPMLSPGSVAASLCRMAGHHSHVRIRRSAGSRVLNALRTAYHHRRDANLPEASRRYPL